MRRCIRSRRSYLNAACTPTSHHGRAAWCLLFTLLTLVLPAACPAGQGTLFQLPMNKRVKNGIIAEVNTYWVDGFGHRPVRIRLSTRKANRDRTITVRLCPNSYSDSHEPMRIETVIEIPQGEKEIVQTVYVPQDGYYNWIRLEFYEDGRRLDDLSMDHGHNINQSYYNNREKPTLLIIDPAAPNLSEERQAVITKLRSESRASQDARPNFPNIETISFLALNHGDFHEHDDPPTPPPYRDVDSLSIVHESPNFEFIPPENLPASYVGLGSVDLAVISFDDLQALQQNDPVRFQAVDGFVRNGGNLIVFGQEDLQEDVSELFHQKHTWAASDPEVYFRSPDRLRAYDDEVESRSDSNRRLRARLAKYPDFFISRHGYGRIVASHAEDPFIISSTYWRFITLSIGSDRLTWTDRHGVALDSGNGDFWDFLIPGYGATPILSFLSVITLFVICIGPINFFVLRRMKRFNLLPFTVVFAALVTTSVMMTYAFFSDGVEPRMRLRSFTHLNQQHDGSFMAATHCRHAYLAAVAPQDGLVFPERTIAYPIVARHHHSMRRRQRINTAKQERAYHHGYMGSRSTSQFLSTDVQPTESRLAASQDTSGSVQAENKLGVPIQHAWVIDGEGVVYYGTDAGTDERLKLTPMENAEARKLLDKILADHRPKPPDGLDDPNRSGFGMYVNYSNRTTYSESALLNAEMSNCSQDLFKGTLHTYIVVTSAAPSFVERGLTAKEEAGFHVIRGSWSP